MIEIDRDDARDAAARELSDPVYRADDPSWLARIGRWISERLEDLFDAAGRLTPGGYLSLLVVLVVVVALIVVVRWRLGPVGRTAAGEQALFGDTVRTAADHRRDADAFAARGEWAEAVRARLRAIVRGLEERDLLDARPGRTAVDAAREAGRALPGCAADLAEAAATFDDVWYGGRPATAEMDTRLRSVDDAVARARPAVPTP